MTIIIPTLAVSDDVLCVLTNDKKFNWHFHIISPKQGLLYDGFYMTDGLSISRGAEEKEN
jgi:hypothetical protein